MRVYIKHVNGKGYSAEFNSIVTNPITSLMINKGADSITIVGKRPKKKVFLNYKKHSVKLERSFFGLIPYKRKQELPYKEARNNLKLLLETFKNNKEHLQNSSEIKLITFYL